jgi:hypothetical protein
LECRWARGAYCAPKRSSDSSLLHFVCAFCRQGLGENKSRETGRTARRVFFLFAKRHFFCHSLLFGRMFA